MLLEITFLRMEGKLFFTSIPIWQCRISLLVSLQQFPLFMTIPAHFDYIMLLFSRAPSKGPLSTIPSLHFKNVQFFIVKFNALFFVLYSNPATPWSLNILYFMITLPPFENIPMVPLPPMISDLFKIKQPSFSTTMQGKVIYLLW